MLQEPKRKLLELLRRSKLQEPKLLELLQEQLRQLLELELLELVLEQQQELESMLEQQRHPSWSKQPEQLPTGKRSTMFFS